MSSDDILKLAPPAPDAKVAYGTDPNQFGEIRVPKSKPPFPLAICIHGGYWRAKYDLAHLGHLCAALTAKGIATWNVEYRRVGNPGGGWPATLEDVRSAYRMLQSSEGLLQVDLKRLCVGGHSAGGHLALCLAAREPEVKRVLSLAGVLDLHRAWELHLSNDAVQEFLGGSPNDVPCRYREASPAEQQIHARQVLIHGTADHSVPYEISQSYANKKTHAGEAVELIT